MDLHDQSEELRALGISVIDQISLEENVEAAVDNAVAEHGRKQKLQILKKEIKQSGFDLKKLLNNEQEYKFKISGMKNRLIDPRQQLAVEKQLSENEDAIKKLRNRRSYLEEKFKGAEIDISELDDFDLELEDGEVIDDEDEDGFVVPKQSESEKDLLIREGKMTPFGTFVNSVDNRDNSGIVCTIKQFAKPKVYPENLHRKSHKNLDAVKSFVKSGDTNILKKYLQDQVDRQKCRATETKGKKRKNHTTSHAYGVPKRKKKIKEFVSSLDSSTESSTLPENQTKVKISPLKAKILHPKRHWKEANLGSFTSVLKEDQRKSPRKPLSESVAFEGSESDNHSDSDYIPSDQEVSSDLEFQDCSFKEGSFQKVEKNKKFKKVKDKKLHQKCLKKTKDDGNIEDFKSRIKSWKREKLILKQEKLANGEDNESEDDDDDEDDYEEFDGGYRIPFSTWKKLYKYQKTCVRWLWELHGQGCGGILGDEMGLGKTIEVISFLIGLSYSDVTCSGQKWSGLGPVLIVCPATVLHQWVKEFHKWWPPFRVAVLHDSGTFAGKRPALIHNIHSHNGILITSYSGLTGQLKILLQYDWQYVILDEGHKIRNPEAQITVAVKRFETPHRLILSGSPIQNSLKELWSLFDFIFPGKLGTLPVFLQQFAVPITQGGYANASKLEVQTAFRCATILRDTINPYLLRRMKNDVRSHLNLPDKNEQVLFCGLTDDQRSLYKDYINGKEVQCIMTGRLKVFVGLINLRKICNHPDLYTGGPKHLVGEDISGLQPEFKYGWWKRAGKMLVLHAVLKLWQKQGHRVLLFTQSRQMLCILQKFLQDENYSYLKMDGSTGIGSRQPMIEKYNRDSSIFVFLLTTRVGGLGVNLTGADRVIIFDPDWNPSTDTQARERAWRIGQTRNVTIYRLLTAGTIEEKIYHRQIFKQFLTNRVLKDPKQQRFFKSNDLFELFTLNEGIKNKTESASIFAGIGSEVEINLKKKKKNNCNKDVSSMKSRDTNFDSFIPKSCDNDKYFHLNNTTDEDKFCTISSKKHLSVDKNPLNFDISEEVLATNQGIDCGNKALQIMTDATECEGDSKTIILGSKTIDNKENLGINDNENPVKTVPMKTHSGSSEFNNKVEPDFQNRDCYNDSHSGTDFQKREKMMLLAKLLSKKIEQNKSKNNDPEKIKKQKKKDKKKGKKFEGERIEFLVKKRSLKSEENEEEKKARTKSQDEFVLERLFKKSGVHTALSHDVIVNSGDPDYLLLESEAERVAKEALKQVRLSRVQYLKQNDLSKRSNKKPRFGLKSNALICSSDKKKKIKKIEKAKVLFSGGLSEDESTDNECMGKNISKSDNGSGIGDIAKEGQPSGTISSSSLLQRMRERNKGVDQMEESEENPSILRQRLNMEEGFDPSYPSTAETECSQPVDIDPELEVHIDLLADIRNFVAFQSLSNGCASTDEIVARFKQRLPSNQSHIFKALLNEICDFRRNYSGQGMWYIKGEFR